MNEEMLSFARLAIPPGILAGAAVGAFASWADKRGGFRAPLFGRVLSVVGSVAVGAFGGFLASLFIGYGIIGPALGILADTAAEVARDGWTAGRAFNAALGLAWIYAPPAVLVAAFRRIR